jgi:hypothetical protein
MADQNTTPRQKSAPLDARVTKVEGFTFDAVSSAVCEALEELYPDVEPEARFQKGPWIRDIYDDVVVYCWDGGLFRVAYAFANGKAELSGTPEAVKVEYVPIGGATQTNDPAATPPPGGAAPPPDGTPDAAAGKRILEETLFGKAAKGLDDSIAALAKRATPSGVIAKKAPLWPADMSPIGKRNTLGRAR